jgi:hypothetical protein
MLKPRAEHMYVCVRGCTPGDADRCVGASIMAGSRKNTEVRLACLSTVYVQVGYRVIHGRTTV